jgi:iron complex outermembrane receptor protein
MRHTTRETIAHDRHARQNRHEHTRDNAFPIGDGLPRVPGHSGRIAIRYRFLDGGMRGLGVGASVSAASGAELTLPNSYRSDSYVIFDAQASYETGPYRIALSVQNLADDRYFLPYQYLGQAVVRPGAPRSAYLTIGLRF